MRTTPTAILEPSSSAIKKAKPGRPSKGPVHDAHLLIPRHLWDTLHDEKQRTGKTVTQQVEELITFRPLLGVLEERQQRTGRPVADQLRAIVRHLAELNNFDEADAGDEPEAIADNPAEADDVTPRAGDTDRTPAPEDRARAEGAAASAPGAFGPSAEEETMAKKKAARLEVLEKRKDELRAILTNTKTIVMQVAAIELLREQWALEDGRRFIPRFDYVRRLLIYGGEIPPGDSTFEGSRKRTPGG